MINIITNDLTFCKKTIYYIDVSVSGPCLVLIKNGVPFNKYEVVKSARTLEGMVNEKWYFDSFEEAEIMTLYLQQLEGVADVEAILRSKKRSRQEKNEYQEMLNTMDLNTLPALAKQLNPVYEKVFVKITRQA